MQVFYQFPYQPWAPVTENKTSRNPDPFLTQPVVEYLRKGEFKKIPWLVGTCKDEGLLYGPGELGKLLSIFMGLHYLKCFEIFDTKFK